MKSINFWMPIIASLVITPFALFAGLVSAGAGHGDYKVAKVLFPYTMLSTFLTESITEPFILIGIIQFPLYGLILAFGGLRKPLGSLAIVLAVVHVLTVALCFFLVSENFS